MFRLAILLITVLPSLAGAQERDPWLGKSVFVKEGAIAKVGNETVDRSKLSSPSTVGDVNGDLLWLGRAWVQKKDVMETQEALEFYTEKIRLNPGVSSNWYGRAAVWYAKGEIENTIKDATEAIRLDPTCAAYIIRGAALSSKGDLDAAIKDYTEAIRLNPKEAAAYSNRGVALQSKGDSDAAIKDLTEAIKLDSKLYAAYNNRGVFLISKGDLDAAIKDYTEAIRLDPKNAIAYNNCGFAHRLKGDLDAVIEDYTEVIRLDPKDATAYHNRGSALSDKGDFDSAIKDYTEAIRLDPKNTDASWGLAWFYATCPDAKHRDGKKAVELATKACELSAWKTWYYVATLAAAYAESDDWENAVKYQEMAIEMATHERNKATGRERLELYKKKVPYRQEVKKK